MNGAPPAKPHAVVGPPLRPRELQDWLNFHLYHPLSARLARGLVGTPVSPNALSVGGGMLVLLAGWCYTLPGWPVTTLLALVLHMGWHVLDGADGDLARLTGRAGPVGEVVDGLSDYFSHIAVYLLLGALLAGQIGWIGWPVMAAAGLTRIAQTTHYEVRRRQYQWWVAGRPWLRNAPFRGTGRLGRAMQAVADFYLGLSLRLEGPVSAVGAVHDAALADPARMQQFRAASERNLRPLLKPLGLLGSNHRTIALGASMLAGTPLYYFLYEAVLLNMVLAWSISAHAAAGRRIIAELE